VAYETMIADRYDVDPKYFAEKYSMPVGDRRNPTAPIAPNDPTDNDASNDKGDDTKKPKDRKEPTDPKTSKDARPFFGLAPLDGAPLDW